MMPATQAAGGAVCGPKHLNLGCASAGLGCPRPTRSRVRVTVTAARSRPRVLGNECRGPQPESHLELCPGAIIAGPGPGARASLSAFAAPPLAARRESRPGHGVPARGLSP